MRSLVILCIIVAILAIQMPVMATATDFKISIDTDDSYLVNASGKATVNIFNNGTSGTFGVTLLSIQSWIQLLTPRLDIAAGETKSVTVYVTPPLTSDPKFYTAVLTATRESTGAYIEQQILVQVKQTVDATISNFSTSCTSCSDRVEFSMDVQNAGTQEFEGTLSADLAGIPRSYSTDIERASTKHISDSLDLTGFQPGKYTLTFNLTANNRTVATKTFEFTIASVENVVYNSSASSSIFGNSVVLTAINGGNVLKTAMLRSQITQAWWSFYSGPAPTSMSGSEYTWTAELPGGASAQIAYSEIVWPLPLIIIALLIIGVYTYMQYAALTVKKCVMGRTMIIPGRDIGVGITVKNARKKAETIAVRELVPSAFSVIGQFGTIKPMIRKLATGTELLWKFTDVGPGEERIIHYKIRPNVNVYGNMLISPSIVRVKAGSRTLERFSNSIVLEGTAKGGTRKLSVEVEK